MADPSKKDKPASSEDAVEPTGEETSYQHNTDSLQPEHQENATATKNGSTAEVSKATSNSDKPTDTSISSGETSSGNDKGKAAEALSKLDPAQMLAGLNLGKKTPKDMESYKFWQTQPVPRFDEATTKPDGEIKKVDPDKVPKEPRALLAGFEWVTMDLEDSTELTEVYELLNGHYVEDDEAQFRLNYSASFFNWALKAPGWRKEWHVGVRATKSRKLIAFISAIPAQLKIRDNTLNTSEVNFLCIHKKLRSKRLAPILIEEITRRCHLVGVYQAIYTGGQILPKPLSSCRYFHRAINWNKLYECGFANLPIGSTIQRQLTRTFIASSTSLPGFRAMEKKDIPAVHDLLSRYLNKFSLAPIFSQEEIAHWLFYDPKSSSDDRMVWGYVVEQDGAITDLMTFYRLDSSIIGNQKYSNIKAAYLFYYATETAFSNDDKLLKERLNALTFDTLVMAKKVRFLSPMALYLQLQLSFDVCNALTLLDNPLFLERQRFSPGDSQLHYYLYNYRAAPVPGGINPKNDVDESKRGGVGVVML